MSTKYQAHRHQIEDSPWRTHRHPSAAARRGVLILVVLALLFLFVLIAITYVLVATRQLSASRTFGKADIVGEPPQQQLDDAMREVLRGSTNSRSTIGPHSLLEDILGGPNGQPVLWGKLAQAPQSWAGGQIIALDAKPTSTPYSLAAVNDTPSVLEGYYEGCVITMFSGPAQGLSTRITRHYVVDVSTGEIGLEVLPFKGESGAITPNNGDLFLINGRPFSGTGFGFQIDSTTKQITVTARDKNKREFALLPNPVYYTPSGDYTAGTPFGGWGGANEDYDAADYQNMFMSWTVPDPSGQLRTYLPSFHRPDLINYWLKRTQAEKNSTSWTWNDPADDDGDGEPDGRALLRQIMLRPYGNDPKSDHPNFTGGNSAFDPVNGPWDVDNRGTGIADSVWLDIGFPIESTSDGRLYKALAAFYILDLDGRLNVNAHGTTEMIGNTHSQTINAPFAGSATNQNISLPRGQGYGPAEIDLTQAGFSQAELTQLFRGSSTSPKYEGRYGEGGGGSGEAGKSGATSPLAGLKRYAYPDNTFDPTAATPATTPANGVPLSAFSSPSDTWGRMAVGIDFRGQPLFWKPAWANETTNCPYDIDLSLNGQRTGKESASGTDDNPFTVFELERLLRPYDVDSSTLPTRLWSLAGLPSSGSLSAAQQKRLQLLTTDSWDPPCPGIIAPLNFRDMNNSGNSNVWNVQRYSALHIVEMVAARLFKNSGYTTDYINKQTRNLLAPELIAGLRLNINRPLGDGRDSDGNGVVDEPSSAELPLEGTAPASANWLWQKAFGTAWVSPNNIFNLTNGMNVTGPDKTTGKVMVSGTDDAMARQLMARYLYVLARLMIDDDTLKNNKWFSEAGLTQDQKKELAVRRIAQWAVNVVDFMDADDIMTPFEYDKDPFSNVDTSTGALKDSAHPERTWCVDGILDDGSGTVSADDNKPWRGLVWGCESLPLLISETLAFHDRRVADTDKSHTRSDPPPNTDLDLDQVRIPEGSLFIELFAPHSLWPAQNYNLDLYAYDTASNQWMLDLGKMAPNGPDGSGSNLKYPVWRLAISKPHAGTGTITNSPHTFLTSAPDSASLDPQQVPGQATSGSLLAAAHGNQDVQIERIVWFAGTPSTHIGYAGDNSDIFYARQYFNPYVNNTARLPAGGYAIVGPRETTYIGSQISSSPAAAGQKWGYPSEQKISINYNNGPLIKNPAAAADYPTFGTQIKQPVGIVCAADKPKLPAGDPEVAKWAAANMAPNGIGLNVSEPLPQNSTIFNYYPAPTKANNKTGLMDAYDDLIAPVGTFLDAPLEKKVPAAGHTKYPVELLPTGPKTATTFNHRTVFLQRLANPLAPYHPKTNPYLTIDWMPVDLTVFNGEDRQPASWSGGQWDPEDDNPNADAPKTVAFASRQRGEYSTHKNGGTYTKQNIWSIWPDSSIAAGTTDGAGNDLFNLGGENPQFSTVDPAAATAPNPPNFRHVLHSQAGPTNANKNATTLGYLNYSYGDPWATSSAPAAIARDIGIAFVTESSLPKPFPWLTWNNRPYANTAELAIVPATHPGRLSLEFTLADTGTNAYDDSAATSQRAPFTHLLNFFTSSKPTIATAPPTTPTTVNFAQILDYIQTPSPYVGTDTVLDPRAFYWNIPAAGAKAGEQWNGGDEPNGTAGLHPPFNFVSNWRDPGRVNINTIAYSEVWNAISSNAPGSPAFTQIQQSRQGYAAGTYSFDPNHPSIFSNPFRSAAGADMVPLVGLQGGGTPPVATIDLRHKSVNGSLLWRARSFDPDNPGQKTPLFRNSPPGAEYDDWQRNPYFAYQSFGNFANKLTTRSNVYAVWVTIGYFEVTPWYGWNSSSGACNTTGTMTIDPSHPDGYQLGQELGADTGDITRHRGFYIIDRTIPVGFQRGQDLNSDKAVLLKRFIE